MLNVTRIMAVVGIVVSCVSGVSADTFGTGDNQFNIDFVTISGATNPTSGYGIVNNDYRMGTYEITNDQWTKFKNSLGVPVTGTPSIAYDDIAYWTGANVPTNVVSWYEAAQFVNWLNTSTGHQAAYRFIGTQGTSGYTLATWSAAEADNGTNLYRHKDAFYYLPTEDEWVKAAYWNGMALQTYATKDNTTPDEWSPTGGPNADGQAAGWNFANAYPDNNSATAQPWDVTAGYSPEELNGTFDMMGNVWEWMESPYDSGNYGTDARRCVRGGTYYGHDLYDNAIASKARNYHDDPYDEAPTWGFRVAAEVPEPIIVLNLDILPSSDRNPFVPNKKSKGRLPMAILATEEVDAEDIDLDSIKIEGIVSPIKTSTDKDIDGDGFVDLMMHFSRRDLIDALSLDTYEVGSEVEITVTAIRLSDGTPIEATDSIVIVGSNH